MRPSRTPRLSQLRDLTVHCQRVQTSHDAAYPYKRVCGVITCAPLESLRLLCEPHPSGAAPSFDPLLERLVARHAQRLWVLMADDRELPHSYVFGCGSHFIDYRFDTERTSLQRIRPGQALPDATLWLAMAQVIAVY